MIWLTAVLQTPIDDPNRLNGYLLLGFVVMGLIATAYLIYLQMQTRNIQQEIELLLELLVEEGKESPPAK